MLGWRSAGSAILIATTLAIAGCGKSAQAPQEGPAAQPPTPQEAASSSATSSEPTQAGVKAYVDESGKLREATPQEIAEAAKQGSAPANQTKPAQRKEVRLPDGTVGVILDESTQESLKACAKADGSVVMQHTCDDAQSKEGKQ